MTRKKEDGTLEIGGYKGEESILSVPAAIGKFSVTSIGDYAFSPYGPRVRNRDIRRKIQSVQIPAGVTEIGDKAFYGCGSLAGIMLPDSITEIGENAFYECSSLTGITLPKGLREIGKNTFVNCNSLKCIALPDSVTKIRSYAFRSCKNLTGIIIPASVTEIQNSAFWGCNKKTIHAPIGSYAEEYAKKHRIPFVAE